MQSSKIIGILIEDLRIEHHTESAYVIEQEMTALGYTCITLSTGRKDEKKADYIRILEQRRVDGAILMGSMFETEAVKKSIEAVSYTHLDVYKRQIWHPVWLDG